MTATETGIETATATVTVIVGIVIGTATETETVQGTRVRLLPFFFLTHFQLTILFCQVAVGVLITGSRKKGATARSVLVFHLESVRYPFIFPV